MVDTTMDTSPTYLNDPFTNVTIDRMVKGGTTVYWELAESFSDPTPWTFTLQWSRSGSDWVDVGTTSNFSLSDSTQRSFNIIKDSYWQVSLTTGSGSYESGPSSIPNSWNSIDLRKYNEARRRAENLYSFRGINGWLLFRKNWGPRCTNCIDPITHEVTNSDCLNCYGTGFEDGYYPPYPINCLFLGSEQKHINTGQGDDQIEQASIRVALTPMLQKKDVVILDNSDKRFMIKDKQVESHIKGYPIDQTLTLTGLSPSDIIYDISWNGSEDPSDGEQQW